MPQEVKLTWFFKQPPQEVWDYLSKPELLEQWLMKSNFQPVAGYKFRFIYTPKKDSAFEGIVDCEVLEVTPGTKLSYSWKINTKDGKRTLNSTVVWTLIPKDNGTEIQLQHTGFTLSKDAVLHNIGWNNCLNRFEELLNSLK